MRFAKGFPSGAICPALFEIGKKCPDFGKKVVSVYGLSFSLEMQF